MTHVEGRPATLPRPPVRRLPDLDPSPDRAELRSTLGMFATGITVVTAGGAVPCGMTANSFTSVSLDPPLVLVCVVREAAIHAQILAGEAFAVSVLSAPQEQVARYFADHRRPRGEHEFDLVDAAPGPHTGAPILAGALAWLECRLAAVYDGGDHSIFLGSVQGVGRDPGLDPLLFFGGGFRQVEPAR
ncbi:MAG TPA: flavin reductase family protein [Actinocrinis sp.]|nr:flavin reductase family protein [Actinocrinis sp.]